MTQTQKIKAAQSGQATTINITRRDGTVTAVIPARWTFDNDGQPIKVTIPGAN